MSEIVNTYKLDNPVRLIPMDRKEFYNEQISEFKKTWKSSRAVEVINILVFNESWEFILQKRSSHKAHNANLIDKTVWWHIVCWDTADYTAMVETVQELQVPSIVLRNQDDFLKTYDLLKLYLTTTAIIKFVDINIIPTKKIIDGEEIEILNKIHFYIWIYWWSTKNADKEAKGVLFYDIDELSSEMENFPNIFTNDLHFYLDKYKEEIQEFLQFIKQ